MSQIEIYAMRCGTVGTDETIPDKSKSRNPYAYTGVLRSGKHKVWLPVYTYLIVHPKGKILVDTGWHTKVRSDQKKHLSWKLNIASKALLQDGEAVTEQLKKIGISSQELDYVLLTHMDVDHVSGLELVKDAKRIFASEAELHAIDKGDIRYNKKIWKNIEIHPIHMEDTGLGPHGRSFDVFQNGTVQFVDLSGHSAGTTGVLVSNHGKIVLITSDACYNHQSWEKMCLPGITVNKQKAKRALGWIHDMSRREGCVEILATHDPEIKPHKIII